MKTTTLRMSKSLLTLLLIFGLWLLNPLSLSAQGGGSCDLDFTTTDVSVCAGSATADFTYPTASSFTLYQIFFDGAALNAGFLDVDDANLPTTPINGLYTIPVDIPATAATGTYSAILTPNSSTGSCSFVQYPITITIVPQPSVIALATPSQTICLGDATQLNAIVTVANITVVISAGGTSTGGFLDETTWTMTNSDNQLNGSGGPYAQNSTNSTDLTNESPPLTFFLETQGIFNDNVAIYNIFCNGTNILSGSLPAGQTLSVPNINCVPNVNYLWSPTTDLTDPTIADPFASPSSTTDYNVTVDYLGCFATSPDITINVLSTSPGAVADDQVICSGGDPVPIVNVSDGSSSSAIFNYQWQSSTTGPHTDFTDIVGATDITYDPPAGLTQTTWYHRIVVTTQNGVTCFGGPTEAVKVLVNPTPIVTATVTPPATICGGESIQLNGTLDVPTLLLNLSNDGFFDETFWTITNALGQTVASGGPYVNGSTNYITIPNNSPPLNFSLSTTGFFNDNIVFYTIYCYDEAIVSGTLGGGETLTVPNINCPNGNIDYNWTPITGLDDPSSSNPLASPAVTTTYSLTASYLGCSATSGTVDVAVNNPTSGVIGSPQTICSGGNPALLTNITPGTGLGAITYQWQSSITGSTSGFSNITGANAITYDPPSGLTVTTWYQRVAFSTFNGVICAGIPTLAVQVTVVPNPIPVISGNPAFCQGSITVLNTSVFNNYAWQGSGGGTINGATNAQSIIAASAGTYSVTVTNGNGCTGSASQLVTVLPVPSISFGTPSANTSCNPPFTGSVGVVSPVGSTIFYLWSNGATTATINQVQGGSYTVTVTDNNGCTNSATVNIPQNTNGPVITLSPINPTACNGNNGIIVINGLSGGTSYITGFIQNGIVQPNQTLTANALGQISLTGLPTGAYTNIIVTTPGGCPSNVANTSLSDPTPPTITALNNSPVCLGNLLTLNSTPLGGSGTYTDYLWTGPDDYISDLEDVTLITNASSGGTYFVTVTDSNGCTGSTSVVVTIVTPPVVTVTNDLFICLGEIATLTASAPTGVDYFWTITDDNNPTIVVAPSSTQLYTVMVMDGNNCATFATVTVTVNPPPSITITNDLSICLGESVTLSAFSPNATDYFWSTQETDPNILVAPTQTTLYDVVVTDVNDCTSSASVLVTVNLPPLITFMSPVANTSCSAPFNGSVGVNTVSADDFSFLWSNGATTAFINQLQGGTYTVTVTDNANGCSSSASVDVPQNTGAPFITLSTNNPTTCGGNNGTIIINGLDFGTSYVVEFTQNGTPQPVQTTIANAAGQIILTGLAAGLYTNIVVNESNCPSNFINTILNNPSAPTLVATTNSPVCQGSSLILNATPSGGSGVYTNFSWSGPSGYSSNLQNNNLIASAATSGIYSVTVTDSNGCTANSNTNPVTVNAIPTVVVNGGNQSLCAGQTTSAITFSGSVSSAIYNWTNNTPSIGLPASGSGNIAAFTALNITAVSVTATISVTPTGNGCVGATQTFTITVLPTPNVTDPANQSLCNGQTTTAINFSGLVGGTTFSWTNNTPSIGLASSGSGNIAGFIAQNNGAAPVTANITVTPSANSCVGPTQTFTITVNPTPNPAPTATPGSVCPLQSSVLTASNGVAYTWSTGQTGSPITVTPAANTTYTVTATNATGCSAAGSVSVSVLPTPIATAGSNNPCNGGILTLNSSGGVAHSWSGPNGFASNQQNPLVSNSATSALNGTYSVTITNANGCTAAASVVVSIGSSLSPVISGATQICFGSTTTLNAGSGYSTYLWSTGVTSQTITTGIAGNYSVTVSNVAACSGSATTSVQVITPPNAGSNNSTTVCNDSDDGNTIVNLNTLITGTLGGIFAPIGGAPPLVNNNDTFDGEGITPGVYQYSYTVAGTPPCPDSQAILTVTVNLCVSCPTPPSATFSYSNTNYCAGSGVVLPALLGGATSGAWSAVPSGLSINSTTGAINLTTSAAGTYTVTNTVAAFNGCPEATAFFIVTVNPLPVANAGANQTICANDLVILTASGGLSYLWSTGTTGATITLNPAITTTYIVTVTNTNGCTASDNVTVTVNPLPVADAGTNQTICANDLVILTASGGLSYLWSTGTSGATITLNPATTTTYIVTVTNANGCTDTDNVTVTVNPLPTVTIIGNTSICSGDNASITFNGTPNATVVYTLNDSGVNQTITLNAGGVATLNTGALTATTVYNLVSISNPGIPACSQTLTVSVTVSVVSPPTALISGSSGICLGGNADIAFTGTPNATVIYTVNGGPDQSILLNASGNALFNTGALGATTVYSLVSVITSGLPLCSQNLTGSATITVVALPAAIINGSTSICPGESATINFVGTPNATVIYEADGTLQSIVLNAGGTASVNTGTLTNTIVYDLISVSTSGGAVCSQLLTGSATVTVLAPPLADAGANQSICAGVSTEFTASGGVSYLWSNGETNATILVSPSETTTYSVTVTDSNNCTATDSAILTVNDVPLASISVVESSGGTNDDGTICNGSSATLTALGGTNYEWSDEAGNTNAISISPIANTVYSVTVTDDNGCTTSAQTNIEVNPLPTFSIAFSAEQLNTIGQIALNTIPISETNTPWSYLWSNGENTANIIVALLSLPPEQTNFLVDLTVTDSNGCQDTEVFDMAEAIGNGECEWPTIDIKQDPPEAGVPKVLICVLDAPDASYQWGYLTADPFTFTPIPVSENPSAQLQTFVITDPDTNKNYAVLTNYNNCWRMAAYEGKQGQTLPPDDLISATPNPNSGSFNLLLQSSYKGSVEVSVCDLSGKVCYRQLYAKADDLFTQQINLPPATGVYLLYITYGQQQQVLKIVKF